jgi:hypothetical protein
MDNILGGHNPTSVQFPGRLSMVVPTSVHFLWRPSMFVFIKGLWILDGLSDVG